MEARRLCVRLIPRLFSTQPRVNPNKSLCQYHPPRHTMRTEPNPAQLRSRASELSPTRPGSRHDLIPSHIVSTTTRLSQRSMSRTQEIASPHQKPHSTSYRYQKSKGVRHEARIWLECSSLKYQGKIQWRKQVRPRQFGTHKDRRGCVTPSDTYAGSAELSPNTSTNFTPGPLEDIKERLNIGKSRHSTKSSGEPEQDTALLQHQALDQSEREKRNIATEKYRATGDVTVFAPFMAPFIAGPSKPNLGAWVWDRSVERFRREHMLNGAVVWAPTDDSFI